MGATTAVESVATRATSLAAGLEASGPERWADQPLGWITRRVGSETTRTRLIGPGGTDAELGAYRAVEPADLYSGLYKANEATRDTNAGAQLLFTDGARVIHAPAQEMLVADDGTITRVPLHVDGLRADGDVDIEITHPALAVVVGKHSMFASDATRLGLELDGRMLHPDRSITGASERPVVAAHPAVASTGGLVPTEVLQKALASHHAKVPAEITTTPVQRMVRIAASSPTAPLTERFSDGLLRTGVVGEHSDGWMLKPAAVAFPDAAGTADVVRGPRLTAEIAAAVRARSDGRDYAVLPSHTGEEWLVRPMTIGERHSEHRNEVVPRTDEQRALSLSDSLAATFPEARGGSVVGRQHVLDIGGQPMNWSNARERLEEIAALDRLIASPLDGELSNVASDATAVQELRRLRSDIDHSRKSIAESIGKRDALAAQTGWGAKDRARQIVNHERWIEQATATIGRSEARATAMVAELRELRSKLHASAERAVVLTAGAEVPAARGLGRSNFVDASGAVDDRWSLRLLHDIRIADESPAFDLATQREELLTEVRRRAIEAGDIAAVVAVDTGDGMARIYQAPGVTKAAMVNTPFERADASVRAIASGDRWADLHPTDGSANYDPNRGR